MKVLPLHYICKSLASAGKGKRTAKPQIHQIMSSPLKIGITDCGKFENYRRWMDSEGVETVKLSRQLGNLKAVETLDGVVFSGGEDLHPGLYGKPEYVEQFKLMEIIPERDHFEYAVLGKVFAVKKPVLGICRGLQLINVFLGGTLVPDIPRICHSDLHGKLQGQDQYHSIEVKDRTLLRSVCGQVLGKVNSAHHQSAELPAGGLVFSAYSPPGIVEAMEWKEPVGKSWLLMVQWHPERMTDPDSPFSIGVKRAFLEACSLGETTQR